MEHYKCFSTDINEIKSYLTSNWGLHGICPICEESAAGGARNFCVDNYCKNKHEWFRCCHDGKTTIGHSDQMTQFKCQCNSTSFYRLKMKSSMTDYDLGRQDAFNCVTHQGMSEEYIKGYNSVQTDINTIMNNSFNRQKFICRLIELCKEYHVTFTTENECSDTYKFMYDGERIRPKEIENINLCQSTI